MNILIDTNVALDALLERQPFYAAASRVLSLSALGVGVFVSASAITDIYYISRRHFDSKKTAMELLKNFLLGTDAATVSDVEIRRAIALDWDDFMFLHKLQIERFWIIIFMFPIYHYIQ